MIAQIVMCISKEDPTDFCVSRVFANKKDAKEYIKQEDIDPRNAGYKFYINEEKIYD